MSVEVPPKSPRLEAFKEGLNLAGLASLAALSAATLNPLPLLAGVVAETAYLIFVPGSRWYEARLSRRFDARIAARREKLKSQILPQLRPITAEQFRRLETDRKQLAEQAMDGNWWLEVLRKLDYLLETFLHFALKEAQFRRYLVGVLAEEQGRPLRPGDPGFNVWVPVPGGAGGRNTSRKQRLVTTEASPGAATGDDRWVQETVAQVQSCYDRQMEDVRKQLAEEADTDTQAVLGKRVEVLQRRREHIEEIGRILINLNHQLLLLDDSFGLINDEIRARPPDQLLDEIEEVVSQTRSMAQFLEEIAPYEQVVQRVSQA